MKLRDKTENATVTRALNGYIVAGRSLNGIEQINIAHNLAEVTPIIDSMLATADDVAMYKEQRNAERSKQMNAAVKRAVNEAADELGAGATAGSVLGAAICEECESEEPTAEPKPSDMM